MPRTTQSVPFSLTEEDLKEIERLAALYTENNKSELVRFSVRRLAAADRAEQLIALREAGSGSRPAMVMSNATVHSLVHQVAKEVGG